MRLSRGEPAKSSGINCDEEAEWPANEGIVEINTSIHEEEEASLSNTVEKIFKNKDKFYASKTTLSPLWREVETKLDMYVIS